MISATFQIVRIDTLTNVPVSFPVHICYYTIDTQKYYIYVNSSIREIMFDATSLSTLQLGETFSTAYRGDRGKIAYDHSQATGNPHGTTKSDIGLGNVDNTSDANKPVSTAQASAIGLKENSITPGTTGQYWRGDKSWQTLDKSTVGLANVDNTSDINKPISTAAQNALDAKADLVGGVIPSSQIPATAISEFCGPVANQSAMLSPSLVTLAGNTPSTGDWCIRSDEQYGYVLVASPHTVLANWQKIVTPGSPVQSVNGQIGVVTLGKSDVGLGNVQNVDTTTTTNISDTALKRFVTDTEKSTWNAKQDALGFTPEDVANKSTNIAADQASNTKYATVKAIYDWAVGLFLQKNSPITAATKTKVTYDANGLITSGADANTDDISEGATNKYWTNARTIASTLTSFVSGAGTVSSSDTILTALQKVVGNIGNKQDALTLTTTGTSGAATLVGNTLNIPQYSGGGGGSSTLTISTKTANYTPTTSDVSNTLFKMNVASANTFTIPTNASQAIAVGTIFLVEMIGSGFTSIAASVGVTINHNYTSTTLRGQYSVCSIVKTATDTWDLVGDFGANTGTAGNDLYLYNNFK